VDRPLGAVEVVELTAKGKSREEERFLSSQADRLAGARR
jgi:hypothetical protein